MDFSNNARVSTLLTAAALVGALLLVAAASSALARPVDPLLWPPSSALRVQWVATIDSPSDVEARKGFWGKLANAVLGKKRTIEAMLHPTYLEADSKGRLWVSDSQLAGLHRFDLKKKKYRLVEGRRKRRLHAPAGVAVDDKGRVYVADAQTGRLLLFSSKGKLRKVLGEVGGEGIFKRPTGLAIDPARDRIYVTDTLRHALYAMSPNGTVLDRWGERGNGAGQFNFPTSVCLLGDTVLVLDSLNFRVRVMTPEGVPLFSFGEPGLAPGRFGRPKGMAVDPKRRLIYVVDGLADVVQAFDEHGTFQFAFGGSGTGPGRFQLATGICVDSESQIIVSDSYNRRLQIFRVVGDVATGNRKGP